MSFDQLAAKMKVISLKAKIALLSISMVSVIIIFNFFIQMKSIGEQKDASIKEYSRSTQIFRKNIINEFKKIYADMQLMSLNGALTVKDGGDLTKIFNSLVKISEGKINFVFYVDADGAFIASSTTTGKDDTTIDQDELNLEYYDKYDWFAKAKSEEYTENHNYQLAGSFISDATFNEFVSKILKRKVLGMQVSKAIKNYSGEIVGVLMVNYDFSIFEEIARSFLVEERNKGLKSTNLFITRHDGSLLFSSKDILIESDKVLYNRNSEAIGVTNLSDENIRFKNFLDSKTSGASSWYDEAAKDDLVGGYIFLDDNKFLGDIDWAIYINAKEDEVLSIQKKSQNTTIWVSATLLIIFFFITIIIATNLSNLFVKVSRKLEKSSGNASSYSSALKNSSEKLFAACENQSSAMQETISSLSEIAGMMKNTLKTVEESKSTSMTIENKTTQGNVTMQKLIGAMETIKESSSYLEEMSSIMNQVSDKTLVINDIVFKTKLLAFNASIEAARAGEHGKGFSVVADEVRSLAEVSGKAANEVEELLKRSNAKVKDIIETSKARINDGLLVSNEVVTSFNEISKGVQEVREQIESIGYATEEQQVGVNQTNQAMDMMDKATKETYENSLNTMEVSKKVYEEGVQINNIMKAIQVLVNGNSNKKRKKRVKTDIVDMILENTETHATTNTSIENDNRSEGYHKSSEYDHQNIKMDEKTSNFSKIIKKIITLNEDDSSDDSYKNENGHQNTSSYASDHKKSVDPSDNDDDMDNTEGGIRNNAS